MVISLDSGSGLGQVTEATLFHQAQAGCRDSLNALMACHEGLVQAVVRRQVLDDLPFSDALQAGRIGLWQAILRFDPKRGVAFSTYAWPCIMHQLWRAVKAQRQRDPPRPPHVALAPEVTADDPAGVCEATLVCHALHALVQRLPPRLRHIVIARYGLEGSPPVTYPALGAQLGLSHEHTRCLHAQALVWLRHPAHSVTLRTLLDRHTLADYQAADALAQAWLRQRGGRDGR